LFVNIKILALSYKNGLPLTMGRSSFNVVINSQLIKGGRVVMKILVVFYSTYGHVYQMAEAVAEGARQVPGADVDIRQVPETLPDEVLEKMGAVEAKKAFSHVPVCTVEELVDADAVIFGTPTRFGNMCGQMRQFLDATGQLWANGSLIGKVGSVFVSSATQHGGQESTILSFHTTLLHHGFVVVGLPYSFQGQMRIDEITGGSPYGASTIAGGDGARMPSDTELEGARFQGNHVAEITAKLAG
jgi:NAD(P)H dehydrogenase (quinone)